MHKQRAAHDGKHVAGRLEHSAPLSPTVAWFWFWACEFWQDPIRLIWFWVWYCESCGEGAYWESTMLPWSGSCVSWSYATILKTAVVNLSMVLRDLCGGLLSIFCPFKIQKMKKTKNMNFYTNSDVCYQEFFIFGKSLKWKDRIKKRYTT